MKEHFSVTNLPKTTTFQMRINPEVKAKVENIYAHCGMTLTDAATYLFNNLSTSAVCHFLSRKTAKKH